MCIRDRIHTASHLLSLYLTHINTPAPAHTHMRAKYFKIHLLGWCYRNFDLSLDKRFSFQLNWTFTIRSWMSFYRLRTKLMLHRTLRYLNVNETSTKNIKVIIQTLSCSYWSATQALTILSLYILHTHAHTHTHIHKHTLQAYTVTSYMVEN